MNVLSLFDGMSCGRIALERAGYVVDKYYSSEIDKHAITISQKNWPDIIHLGSVTDWKSWPIEWDKIVLLIGGSPCQGFSSAGLQKGLDDDRSVLFYQYLDILNHIQIKNPNVKYLLENVRMSLIDEAHITRLLKVNPIHINSALVSAQRRNRIYWLNWTARQPIDKKIHYKTILDSCNEVFYTQRNDNKERILHKCKDKIPCLMADYGGGSLQGNSKSFVYWGKQKIGSSFNFKDTNKRKLLPVECERLQNVPDNYTDGIRKSQRLKMLGNGWTVDIIAHLFNELRITPNCYVQPNLFG